MNHGPGGESQSFRGRVTIFVAPCFEGRAKVSLNDLGDSLRQSSAADDVCDRDLMNITPPQLGEEAMTFC